MADIVIDSTWLCAASISAWLQAIFYSLSAKVRKITNPAAAEIVLGHHRAMLPILRKRDGAKAQALFHKHFDIVWEAAITND